MNNIALAMLVLIGSVSAVYTDLPEQMKRFYDDGIEATQQVCTAGDLRSMSVMLDANYVLDRRLPSEEEFKSWLTVTFKENNVKDLAEDHWGNRYIYAVSEDGRSYRLRSAGPDGIAETADDMIKSGP
jgi:general secretion pathway protein G